MIGGAHSMRRFRTVSGVSVVEKCRRQCPSPTPSVRHSVQTTLCVVSTLDGGFHTVSTGWSRFPH
ncbi:hypothetical protein ASG12_09665 [Williamsia sp. Leaf354]|nr:hypothetical protein ASG12_09665 [Williamsia sp. Leaf354]